ncbi:nucleoside triphosphate pyrophosphohydrolase ham1 [Blastocladiella emersonii ATCC 22665]|nr:nucleoside triphosphate pyrophosphohydrolase ham1 [Blastocladiella emersonii ATCC 22665]
MGSSGVEHQGIVADSSEKPLVFVTGNANKLREVQAILGSRVPLLPVDIDLPEYQGDPRTVSTEKCRLAATLLNGPVIVEDTALCFNALNGLPGPYIKWFYKSLGLEGLVRMLHGFDDKTAYVLTTFAYSDGPGAEPVVFQGRNDGTIVAPRGPTHFGWTPVFQPDGWSLTYAEMSGEVKNRISARSRALRDLAPFLEAKLGRGTPTPPPGHHTTVSALD